MKSNIINQILDELTDSIKEPGKFIKLNYRDYEPIEINKDNFHEIKSIDSNKKIAFIDGGNSEILKSSNFSLQLIRVFYTIFQNNKRIDNNKYEFYLLIKSTTKDDRIFFKTSIIGDKIIDNLEFDSLDKSIVQGTNRAQISYLGNVARRFAELNIAIQLMERLSSNDSIVLDGSLESKYTNEEGIIQGLVNRAKEKNILLGALSKTCELFTDSGNSMISVLKDLGPDGAWYYHPLAKISDNNFDISFVKLHKNSNYIFRLDTLFPQENIISLLAANSTDPVFLGYPYGLIVADRMARITNKEVELLKTRFRIAAGKNWTKINNYLRTKNSHDILDNIE